VVVSAEHLAARFGEPLNLLLRADARIVVAVGNDEKHVAIASGMLGQIPLGRFDRIAVDRIDARETGLGA
jgi:hypothetical protein